MTIAPAETFLAALTADIAARAQGDDRLIPFVEALRAIDPARQRYGAAAALDHPTMAHLPEALGAAHGSALAAAAADVARVLRWYQVFQSGGETPASLVDGMLAAQVAGNIGMVESETLRCGLFLLAPGLHYPLHTHGASEIYYGLSGELELAYGLGEGGFALGPGALSVTPSHRIHSLTTGAAPVLLIYLWIGDLDAPNWWWRQGADGAWARAKWVRMPDASWRRESEEAVTEAVMAEALGRGRS
ncbi:MAG: dimethylsulfonioproprionate lyase family protein [Roseovarius sp.]